MKRLDQITFARFVVVLSVLVTHGMGNLYFAFANSLGLMPVILTLASIGVASLYVLSGFVLSIVYFQPHQKFDLANYFRARFIRVYPLYLMAFLLTCFYYRDALLTIKPQKILANIFILQSWIPAYSQSFNYPSWSVSVEVFFYFLFPFFIIWAYRHSTKKLIWLTLGVWAMSQVLYHVLWIGYLPTNRSFVLYFPLLHISSFFTGVIGGIWYKREGSHLNAKPSTIILLLIGSIIFILGYGLAATFFLPSLPTGYQPVGGLLAPIAILIILLLAIDKSKVSAFLNHPMLVALGEGAYALYILHIPVAWNFEAILENSSVTNPRGVFDLYYLPMMIAISLVAHYYVDAPFRKWLKDVIKRVNFPLLLLDLIIITASIYFSFRLRFDHPREYESYRQIGRLIFYSAFFIRPALSVIFNTFDLEIVKLPLGKLIRPLLISTTISSASIAVIAYVGYAAGLSINFPRSIFILDWMIVFSLSLIVRLAFRMYWINKPISHSSEQGITHVR